MSLKTCHIVLRYVVKHVVLRYVIKYMLTFRGYAIPNESASKALPNLAFSTSW